MTYLIRVKAGAAGYQGRCGKGAKELVSPSHFNRAWSCLPSKVLGLSVNLNLMRSDQIGPLEKKISQWKKQGDISNAFNNKDFLKSIGIWKLIREAFLSIEAAERDELYEYGASEILYFKRH